MIADRGDAEQAIDVLRAAEGRAEKPARLMTLRGRMLFSLGRREDAERAFREALDVDSRDAGAARELGLLCLDTDRRSEGEAWLRKALSANPADPAGWFRLGYSAAGTGRWEEAEKAYRRVLLLVPGDPATMNNLALTLARMPKRRAEAVDVAAEASKSRPDDPRLADTLGRVLYLAGRYDDAAKVLAVTAPKLPESASTWFHAGMACFRAYRWDEARTMLRKALTLAEKEESAPEWVEEAREALKEVG
jgi:Flp pilus assembly protein TadD